MFHDFNLQLIEGIQNLLQHLGGGIHSGTLLAVTLEGELGLDRSTKTALPESAGDIVSNAELFHWRSHYICSTLVVSNADTPDCYATDTNCHVSTRKLFGLFAFPSPAHQHACTALQMVTLPWPQDLCSTHASRQRMSTCAA
jgi:hypothetical protein